MNRIDPTLLTMPPQANQNAANDGALREGDQELCRTLDFAEAQMLAAMGKTPQDYCTLVLDAAAPPQIAGRKPDGALLMSVLVEIPGNLFRSIGKRSPLTDGHGNAQPRPVAQLGLPPTLRLTVRTDAIEVAARDELLAALSAAPPAGFDPSMDNSEDVVETDG